MCTATWLSRPGGYELFFGRDEARARRAASPPRALEVAGVRVLAPRDGEAGGSWIAAGEQGLTLALLNARTRREPALPRTRGALVLALAGAPDLAALERALAASALERCRGFRLLALAPGPVGAQVRLWRWDGEALAPEEPAQPLASSSLGSERARHERAGALARLAGARAPDAALLERFHRGHDPEAGPWSACVHRPDVVTHSLCHVRVDERAVELRYAAGSPCESLFGAPLALARRPLAQGAGGARRAGA